RSVRDIPDRSEPPSLPRVGRLGPVCTALHPEGMAFSKQSHADNAEMPKAAPLFTPKGWHSPAQGAAGAGPADRPPALKGRNLSGRGPFLLPFQGEPWGGAARVPRTLPWARECHPFGVKKGEYPTAPVRMSE